MNGWYLAARITVAIGIGVVGVWVPVSIWMAAYADDAKHWWSAFLGGAVVIAVFFAALAGAMGAFGWAFG